MAVINLPAQIELSCKIHNLVGIQMSRLSVGHAMGTCIWEELHVWIGPFSLCARVIFGPFLISLISSLSFLAAAAEVKHQLRDQITKKRGGKYIIAERRRQWKRPNGKCREEFKRGEAWNERQERTILCWHVLNNLKHQCIFRRMSFITSSLSSTSPFWVRWQPG